MTLTRGDYITLLEKTAAESATALSPDYHIDNAEVARGEHTKNRADSRTELKSLFSNAGSVESGTTKQMDSLLPSKSGMDRETSNPLLKVAHSYYATRHGDWYAGAVGQGFLDEFKKIASQIEGMLRALGSGAKKAVPAVKPTSLGTANKALQGYHSLGASPTAMPSFPGLAR